MYNNYNEEINADLVDLLRSSKDDEESKTNDKEEFFKKDDNKQDEYQLNWILLLEMSPRLHFDCSSDLGFRNMTMIRLTIQENDM